MGLATALRMVPPPRIASFTLYCYSQTEASEGRGHCTMWSMYPINCNLSDLAQSYHFHSYLTKLKYAQLI